MSDNEPEKLSPVLWRRGGRYLHWCPACRCGHTYHTNTEGRPSWSFNGNVEKPSFSPSMRIFTPAGPYGDNGETTGERTICHYYVTDGKIIYQEDCHHGTPFFGGTFDLRAIPEDYGF